MNIEYAPQERIGEFVVGSKVRWKGDKVTVGTIVSLYPVIRNASNEIQKTPYAFLVNQNNDEIACKLEELEMI